MKNIGQLDSILVFTSIISLVAAGSILILPVIIYLKEFNKISHSGKSYLEIFKNTFVFQFALTLVISSLAWVWNTIVGIGTALSSYSFAYGTAFGFGMFKTNGAYSPAKNFAPGEGFWTAWEKWGELGVEKFKLGAAEGVRAIASALIVENWIVTFIWMILAIFPIVCITLPIYYFFRKEGTQQPQLILTRCINTLILFISLVLAGFIHMKIASLYVVMQLQDSGFDYWQSMVSIWTKLLKG